jgi:hypothetical protein
MAGAHIDYYFTTAPAAQVKLNIVDSAGRLVRSFASALSSSPAADTQEMGGRRFGGGAITMLPRKTGMNRFVWDLRHFGPERSGGGPLAVPGRYQVRLTAGKWSDKKWLEIKMDPRVAADGVTPADLQEQLDFSLKVRDALTEARRLSNRIREVREKMRDDAEATQKLKELSDKVVTSGGIYPQPMLIDQFSNIARMIGQADQRIGKDAFVRYNDLMREMSAIKTELDRITTKTN